MNELKEECGILYVGDLKTNVTEKILFDNFKNYGKILSIRVCKDLNTKKSLGYAYVNFYKKSEAKNAMDSLNLCCINGQPCRIMWFEKDSSKRKSGVGNIIIKNIDDYTTVQEIHDIFSNFGEIKSCKLKADESGLRTGCAYVNYENEEDAESAIAAMDQNILGENVVTVEKFHYKGQVVKEHLATCFVDNFPGDFDDSVLKSIFEKYGTITCAKVMLNEDGRSKGFGFVSYKEVESAANATKELNGRVIQQKRIHVYRVFKKSEASNNNLYINNLPRTVNDERLRQEFQVFGKITSAKVMINPMNEKSLSYGFVCFAESNGANRAIREMNGRLIDGKKIFVALNKNQGQEEEPQSVPSCIQQNQFINYDNLMNAAIPAMRFPMPTFNMSMPIIQYPNNMFRLQRVPFMSPTIRPFSYPLPNPGITVKQMFGDRLYPHVCRLAGSKALFVMKELMEISNEDLIGLIENESLLQNQIVKILTPTSEVKTGENSNSNTTAPDVPSDNTESSSEEESSKEDENDEEDKRLLCHKMHHLIEEFAGTETLNIIELLMKCGQSELLYMIANQDYLKIKVEKLMANMESIQKNSDDDNVPHSYTMQINNSLNNKMPNFSEVTAKFPKMKILDLSHITEDEEALLSRNRKITIDRKENTKYKNKFGEKVYSLVSPHAGDMAGFITGMFLQMDNKELQTLLEDDESLKMKVFSILEGLNDSGSLEGSNPA